MTTINITLYISKTLKDGSHPIMIRLTKFRQHVYLSTGFSAHAEQWDEKRQEPKRQYPHSQRLKQHIAKKKYEIHELIFEFENRGDHYNLSDLKNQLVGGQKLVTIPDYYDQVVARLLATDKGGNARVYKESKRAFMTYCKEQRWRFEELNYRRIKGFEEYLSQQGLKVNSIAYHLRTVRALYNRAIKEGLVDRKYYPFEHFSIKSEKTAKRALDIAELRRIEDTHFEHPGLAWAKDMFLFSYYCQGMSFKDMAYLRPESIVKTRIYYQRSKTSIQYNIGIHPKLQALIAKYEGASTCGFLLPIIEKAANSYGEYRSDLSRINKLLKRMGKELELSIPLTSYVSRHSYATIAKRKGISTSIISQALGHTTEKTTQIYLDSFESEVLDEANNLIFE